ncbi:MAG: MlaD family protein [Chthoniobacterales bacterium]
MMAAPDGEHQDHGQVVRGGVGFSWAWLFPLIALAAAAYMYTEHLNSMGPEIQIRFADAPGIEEGKTSLIYRGVVAGKVTEVNLNEELNEAIVHLRLEKFAAGLAVETTDFWIEKPVLSLQGASGLTSLIQGNSIQARKGTGKRRLQFDGLDSSPVLSMNENAVHARLESDQTQTLSRGAPVTFRGVVVGRVREQSLSSDGKPYIDVDIQQSKRSLLKTTSRFWTVPASAVTMGPGGIKVDFPGLDTLIQGAVAFDDFGVDGPPFEDGSNTQLLASEELAKACGTPITIIFPSGKGLRAGQTRMTYLGVPVGMVTDLRPSDGKVAVTARFNPGFDFLRFAGSRFALIEPMISLQGVSGLETIITGVIIDCEPGRGASLQTRFEGSNAKKENEIVEQSEAGRKFRLFSSATGTGVGAPVLYRELQVGVVLSKQLGPDGKTVELIIGIQSEYARLVRGNTVFWEERGLRGSVGFVNIRLQTAMPLPLAGNGAVAFGSPDDSAPPAAANTKFPLYDKPRREWKKWIDSPLR